MAAAKVTLALYGHNHRLERISAAFANKTVLASVPVTSPVDGTVTHVYERPTATVHYVAGTGGAGYTKNDCFSQGSAPGGERTDGSITACFCPIVRRHTLIPLST